MIKYIFLNTSLIFIDDKSLKLLDKKIPLFISFGILLYFNKLYIWSICCLILNNNVSPNPSPTAQSAVTLIYISSV